MEPKTYHQIEKNRFSNLMTGFCIISGLVLAAFSYGNIEVIEDRKVNTRPQENLIVQRDEVVEPPKVQQIPQTQTIQQPKSNEIDLTQDLTTTENKNQTINDKEVDRVIDTDNTITNVEGDGEGIVIVTDPVIEFPDVEATFPGGEVAMRQWMMDNLHYPEISIENGDKGRVFLKFVVEKDGTISNIEVVKGSTKELDMEAKRMIRTMPKWDAGESEGRKVRSTFTLPINFELY